MIGEEIPLKDSISRYCGKTTLSELNGLPTADAYKLSNTDRENNPPYLSFNWLEYYKSKTHAEQIEEIRTIINNKMRRIGTQAKLVLLVVEQIHKEFENAQEKQVKINHLPVETSEWEDPSHCGLFWDIDQDEDVIATLIAQTSSRLEPAKKQ